MIFVMAQRDCCDDASVKLGLMGKVNVEWARL